MWIHCSSIPNHPLFCLFNCIVFILEDWFDLSSFLAGKNINEWRTSNRTFSKCFKLVSAAWFVFCLSCGCISKRWFWIPKRFATCHLENSKIHLIASTEPKIQLKWVSSGFEWIWIPLDSGCRLLFKPPAVKEIGSFLLDCNSGCWLARTLKTPADCRENLGDSKQSMACWSEI